MYKMEEFKELCEQCENNDDIKCVTFDEFMKDLLMEQQEQM